jgi:hypothetical protein
VGLPKSTAAYRDAEQRQATANRLEEAAQAMGIEPRQARFVALRGGCAYKTVLKGTPAMAHNYAINDDVHHQLQGPQGRAAVKERSIYTIVSCLPIESDGRPRYRIKSKTENIERVVTEEQISRLG